MAVETLKSTSITNEDATPIVANATGAGAPGGLRVIDDYKTVPASTSVTSTIRLVRIPTNAKVKSLFFESEAQGAGKFDVGLYYSSSTTDGTPAGVRGTALDSDFFATAVDVTSAVTPTDITNESGTYTLDKRSQPIWQAAGLTTDPGGYFDIVATCITTAVTTGTGKLGVRCNYVM